MFDIITAFTDNYKEFFNLSEPVLTDYCNKNNYERYVYSISNNYSRPASWYKVERLLEHTRKGKGFSLWLDIDTIIVNSNFKLESLIVENKFIYISKDINNINAGVLMIKNNDYCNNFFTKVWNSTQYLNHCWWEQAAIIELIEQNYMNIAEHIEYVPQNILNAYEYIHYGYPDNPGQVNSDSFIFHCPALSYPLRLRLLQKYKNFYNESSRTHIN